MICLEIVSSLFSLIHHDKEKGLKEVNHFFSYSVIFCIQFDRRVSMQKIYFKKKVDLNHQLKELVSISVDESISYKMESQGIRAIGSIIINGEYKDTLNKKQFQKSIDLDLFAQFEKITDKRDFHVKVEDFDYTVSEGDLSLVIQACVYGVKDDNDRVIEAVNERTDTDVVQEIEELLREEEEKTALDMNIPQEVQEPVVETAHIEEELKQDSVHVAENEEDDEDLGTYYLYVVYEGDSYRSIAEHYQVDEYKLRDYNHDRALSKGTIVIVPYLP